MRVNDNHPELRDGEVWLMNAKESAFKAMRWGTKRAGAVAYDRNGRPLPAQMGCFPIFVLEQELADAKDEITRD